LGSHEPAAHILQTILAYQVSCDQGVVHVLCFLVQGQEPSGSSVHNKSLHCISCDTPAAATEDAKAGCGKWQLSDQHGL
jgi:hypothetical protein